ncbi:MAG: hypothetical protein KVP17_004333 [Porospora cf. gigantea B]|uniref:uncharacterized protein n=1 Tax=Porospora cf. gigantea B TaxID=2853592 RepID=UPI003571EBED|nr:MAG: hypothetical protein KVP17_004333 [Porospora cf. gigantea B]
MGICCFVIALWSFVEFAVDPEQSSWTLLERVASAVLSMMVGSYLLWAVHIQKAETLSSLRLATKVYLPVLLIVDAGFLIFDVWRFSQADTLAEPGMNETVAAAVMDFKIRTGVLIGTRTLAIVLILSCSWPLLGSMKSLARVYEAGGDGTEYKSAVEIAHPHLAECFNMEQLGPVLRKQRHDRESAEG